HDALPICSRQPEGTHGQSYGSKPNDILIGSQPGFTKIVPPHNADDRNGRKEIGDQAEAYLDTAPNSVFGDNPGVCGSLRRPGVLSLLHGSGYCATAAGADEWPRIAGCKSISRVKQREIPVRMGRKPWNGRAPFRCP